MKKAPKCAALTAAASLAMISQPAMAETYCEGPVAASWITETGSVLIVGAQLPTPVQICNVDVVWKTIKPSVCVMWAAKADSAVALGLTLRVYYTESIECSAVPVYEDAPSPYYVMLL